MKLVIKKMRCDPNALSFEPFLPWIHKLMLSYPPDIENLNKPKSIPSRSTPSYYTKKLN